MTTNHVQELQPGHGLYAFFLNAQGRILSDVRLFCGEDSFLLDTEPALARPLFEHIDRYIIADDVTLTDETGTYTVIAIEGPAAEEAVTRLSWPAPTLAYSFASKGALESYRVSYTGAPGWWISVSVPERDAALQALRASGLAEASRDAVETVRIENGRALYGVDFAESSIPHETQLMHALHFSKGCYLGQEIVERVRSRGHVNRTLQRLVIAAGQAPSRGTKILAGDKEAGEITSAAFSPAQGKSVALAVVRGEFIRGNAALTVNGAEAQVAGPPLTPSS
jgi:aminomethyltransferase